MEPSHDPWLDRFRTQCDPLADDAVAAMTVSGGSPSFAVCERLAADGDGACRRFVDTVAQMPEWVQPETHELGRRMFERNGALALLVGFTVLVDSYGGGRDNKVLMMSGRLSGDRAFRRLVETAAFVADVIAEGALAPGANGHRAIVSVRLLHARVRAACRERDYDVERYDEPINQEAMCGTLMLFSSGVIMALERLGAAITDDEKQSYHALWRAAGWLLGVDEQLLPETYVEERALYERVKAHSYWPDDDSRALFDAAVEGVAEGAKTLPAGLQLAGGGLLRSRRFLRTFTWYCVDPRLSRVVVDRPYPPAVAAIDAMRVATRVSSRAFRLPGVRTATHRMWGRVFDGIVAALLAGRPPTFDDPGFAGS